MYCHSHFAMFNKQKMQIAQWSLGSSKHGLKNRENDLAIALESE